MFSKIVKVLFLESDTLSGAEVVLSSKPKLKKLYQATNLQNSFEVAIKKMLAILKSKQIYLLLGEDYFYSQDIEIPVHIQNNQKRKYIKDKASEYIPEALIDGFWDYVSKTQNSNLEIVTVYSLIVSKYKTLKVCLDDVGVTTLSITPKNYLEDLNSDPFLALASLIKKSQDTDDKSLYISGRRDVAIKSKTWFDIIFGK